MSLFTGLRMPPLISGFLITILSITIYLTHPVFLKFIDGKVYDLFLISVHNSNISNVPIIIDIDDKSLKRYGQWPWPRYRIALLLERLKALRVATVGVDIVFSEHDRTSLDIIKKTLLTDLNVSVNFEGVPDGLMDNDKILAATLNRGPYVIGYKFLFDNPNLSCVPKTVDISFIDASPGAGRSETINEPVGALCNIPILSNAVKSMGYYNAGSDRDGIFRMVPLLMKYRGKYYPNLALATFLYASGSRQLLVKRDAGGIVSIKAGGVVIPVDSGANILIHYRGGHMTFPYYSASDILDGRVPEEKVSGRIAFLGSSASGLLDIRSTPLDAYFPGVEVYATILDTIINKDFLSTPGWSAAASVFILLLVGILSTIIFARSRALTYAVSYIALLSGITILTWRLMIVKGYYISPSMTFIMLTANLVVTALIKFYGEESQKRFLQGAFSKYVSGEVVNELIKNPGQLTLQGEEKEITILFSDIRGFTTMSETMTPVQIGDLLREYFTPMTRIIKQNNGTLDKFIGDAIMAFYNAPLDVKNHQACAVTSAMQMIDGLEELNIELQRRFNQKIATGIGLHSGVAMVGNMGSFDLFNYSVIGDNVNLASRIEGLTKKYGQKLLVSDAIEKGCAGLDLPYGFVQMDMVRVKGKTQPVTLYTVLGKEKMEQLSMELSVFKEALATYFTGDFSRALDIFTTLKKDYTQTTLYELYIKRCKGLLLTPLKEEWDGVYTHDEK